MDEPVIKKEQYFFYLDAGVPYEGWVDFGDGNIARALKEVRVVNIPYNKYNHHFVGLQTIAFCVMDNTKQDTGPVDAKKEEVENNVKLEQKKKELKRELQKKVDDYFVSKFNSKESLGSWKELNQKQVRLNLLIAADERPISLSDFPQDFRWQNMTLVNEFIKTCKSNAVYPRNYITQGELSKPNVLYPQSDTQEKSKWEFKLKSGATIYGMWFEQLFDMGGGREHVEPSIDWGGPWWLELPLRAAWYLKKKFAKTDDPKTPVAEPYIVSTRRIHSTIITKDFGPDPLFKGSNNVLYESDYHQQHILRTRETYSVGDTINYYLERTWSNGVIDSIPYTNNLPLYDLPIK